MSETTKNIFEKAYGNLDHIGRTWASAALTSTSESLKATADFLSSLSAKLQIVVEKPEAEQDEPEKAN